jgi:TRAP-type C4-dicarboxylate transport system permease small subunit
VKPIWGRQLHSVMADRINRTVLLLRKVGLWISGFSLISMILIVTLEVVSRRFFGFSLFFAYEYSGYLLIAMTFMGASFTLNAGGFTRMEIVYTRFRGKALRILDFLVYVVSFLYLLIIAYWLWGYVASSYETGVTSISIAQTPLYLPRAFMFLGVVLLVSEVGAGLIKLMMFSGDRRSVDR